MDYAQRLVADAATAALIAQGAIVAEGKNILLGNQITGELADTILRTVPAQREDEQGAGVYIGTHQGKMLVYIRDWGELGLYWAAEAAPEYYEFLESLRGMISKTA
ncbi:hypothetical protein KLP40_14430 [Hymenobacter sp. NST-14]|uniref:hypothetical protein n=1 Tax=Hymenobacter piscis TaxID=2839984 RepID=UPI001C0319BB|nr:hypothetical protein [Hymenobacter piscis]MBT9394364.1 hypothetical protein [Hymenobacter piscis]